MRNRKEKKEHGRIENQIRIYEEICRRFNDDILLQITDAGAHLCFNADIDMSNEDLTKLRRNVIGL